MTSLYTELRKEYLKTWRIWFAINQRCDPQWRKKYSTKSTQKRCYDVVDEWSIKEYGQEGFLNFFDCVGDLEHVEDLHRKDTDKPYGPRNWVKGDIDSRTSVSCSYNTEQARWMRRGLANGIPKWVYYKRLHEGLTFRQAATRKYTRTRKAKAK